MTLRPRTILARQLRRDSTHAEHLLWRALRESLPGRFRRQHPIGQRIADFACPVAKLAVELDGGQHAIDTDEDAARSAELATHGYRVLRFWNHEVTDNLDGVLQRILSELTHPPPPQPLRPQGRRGFALADQSSTARTIPPPPLGAEGLGEVGDPLA